MRTHKTSPLIFPLNCSDTYTYSEDEEVAVQVTDNALLWTMNKTSYRTEWEHPTLMQVASGSTSCTAKQHVIQLPQADQWVLFVIHSPFAQGHRCISMITTS